MVEATVQVLEKHGHHVTCFRRSSAEIPHMCLGRVRAFFSGIYSFWSRRQISKLLAEEKPDVVHVHNVFPLISPSVLGVCRRAGVPVVMTVHNYRLVCPNGLHMPKGSSEICERCCGGREYWCLLKRCEENLFKSLGYSLRNYVARQSGMYRHNVAIYICLTEFQRQRLLAEGFAPERLTVVPNMIDSSMSRSMNGADGYVAYVGRISPEKGVDCLLEAAQAVLQVSFRIAGDCSSMQKRVDGAPANVEYVGQIPNAQVAEFIGDSRFVVLPSIWFEGFPMVLVEAMMCEKAVIASRIGGIPDIVEDGVTGLLCEPNSVDDLAKKIAYLWENPELSKQMGRAGREKALGEYLPERYYERLMAVYKKAARLQPPRRPGLSFVRDE